MPESAQSLVEESSVGVAGEVQVQPDGRAGGPRQATGPRKSITAVVPSEWTEPVRLAVLSGVLKALATGGDMPGNLVVVSSVEQYLELRDQFAAVACYAPLSVIIDDARRRQMPGVSEVRATVKRGPASPKPETLMLACIPDGAGGPKVKPVVRMDVAKYQPAAKVTVRVSAPSHYRQLFLDRWDTAQTVLTELAQWQDGPVSALLGGQWNWVTTKGTHHLVAHLRVPPSVADQLISRSGRNGILVTKAGVADKAPPQAMLWLKKEDHEDAECYFRRALATANTRNQSLKIRAGGGSDLGVPRLDTDGVPNTPIVIEAQTPRPWESEDVQRFLSDQGWQELTVLSRRKRNKFHVLWTVRGLPPTEETCGPWHYVDQGKPELQVYAAKTVFRGAKATEIFAVTAPSKRFKPEQTPAVQTGKGVEAEGDAHDARSVIKETRPAADDAEQSERDRSPRRKAPAAPAQNPQAEAEDEITQALRSGWVRMDQKGDGDCAFRCVAAARHFNATREALSEDISRREGGLIRGQAVGHIRTHEDTYLPYFAKDRDHDPADPDPSQRGIAQTFHEWLQQMATPNCWADGLTLQGIASKLGFALVIWAKTPEKTWKRVCLAQSFGRDRGSGRFAQMAKDQQPIVLLLEDSHYTWLRPEAPDTTVPRQWLRESVVPERLALAGGGDQAEDCALSSPATPSVHSLESGPDSPKPSVATASVYSLQYSQPATHVDCPKAAGAPSVLSQGGAAVPFGTGQEKIDQGGDRNTVRRRTNCYDNGLPVACKKVWAQIPVKAMNKVQHIIATQVGEKDEQAPDSLEDTLYWVVVQRINQDLSANCKPGTAFFDAPIPGADPGLLSKKAPAATQSAPLKADVLRAHDRLKESMSQIDGARLVKDLKSHEKKLKSMAKKFNQLDPSAESAAMDDQCSKIHEEAPWVQSLQLCKGQAKGYMKEMATDPDYWMDTAAGLYERTADLGKCRTDSKASRNIMYSLLVQSYLMRGKTNVTLQTLNSAIVVDFTKLSQEGVQVGGEVYYFIPVGFRGDLKQMCQAFNLTRKPGAEKAQRIDYMHTFHLGVARDLVGTALKIIATGKYWFSGNNINARLKQIVAAVKVFAKQTKQQISIKKLSKNSLGWSECPEFKGSAADSAVFLAWLATFLVERPPLAPYDGLAAVVWVANHICEFLYGSGCYLSDEAWEQVRVLAKVFFDGYTQLAICAHEHGQLMYKM
ncbi:L96, partial [Symbiodinium microadriaticum]